ncbi:MAG TPA: hypothetical protein VGU45_16420 [Microvirga sp.]|jgi:hypothetical protein|nr:hypothetical protein [Microvirga sp.]
MRHPRKANRTSQNAPQLRYIRLGKGNAWIEAARDESIIVFGDNPVPAHLARRGDVKEIERCFEAHDYPRQQASRLAGEVTSFYTLPADTVWVTFEDDHVWWCRAEEGVRRYGNGQGFPQVYRRAPQGWRNTDEKGRPLLLSNLPGAAAATSRCRHTLFTPTAHRSIWRFIQGRPNRSKRSFQVLEAELREAVLTRIRRFRP